MPLKQPKRSAAKAMLILTLISLSACEPVVTDACAWLTEISPDPGFESRWTQAEKVQVDTLDLNIDHNCRGK